MRPAHFRPITTGALGALALMVGLPAVGQTLGPSVESTMASLANTEDVARALVFHAEIGRRISEDVPLEDIDREFIITLERNRLKQFVMPDCDPSRYSPCVESLLYFERRSFGNCDHTPLVLPTTRFVPLEDQDLAPFSGVVLDVRVSSIQGSSKWFRNYKLLLRALEPAKGLQVICLPSTMLIADSGEAASIKLESDINVSEAVVTELRRYLNSYSRLTPEYPSTSRQLIQDAQADLTLLGYLADARSRGAIVFAGSEPIPERSSSEFLLDPTSAQDFGDVKMTFANSLMDSITGSRRNSLVSVLVRSRPAGREVFFNDEFIERTDVRFDIAEMEIRNLYLLVDRVRVPLSRCQKTIDFYGIIFDCTPQRLAAR